MKKRSLVLLGVLSIIGLFVIEQLPQVVRFIPAMYFGFIAPGFFLLMALNYSYLDKLDLLVFSMGLSVSMSIFIGYVTDFVWVFTWENIKIVMMIYYAVCSLIILAFYDE
ncbi:hypothetical protein ACFLRF_02215 [Candidatus Altiarchaeota archaeon]